MDQAEYQKIDKAVRLALKHIVSNGMDDIFRKPMFSDSYEHSIIKGRQAEFETKAYKEGIAFIKSADLSNKRIGSIYRCIVPKDLYSYRNVHWIDPFDLVKYLSLAIILFDSIENARHSKHAKIVHSHRRSDDETLLFDREYGYKSFRELSGNISRSLVGKWKVVTDISVFFDRIGNHHLENNLHDIGCEVKYVTLLKEVLFQWAGDRRSHGVPVGCDASRIISEAALLSVDRKLSEKSVRYVRYVDDFRIFAETRAEAYEHLRLLSELLMAEGLQLNHKKTSVSEIVSDVTFGEAGEVILSEAHEVIDEKTKVATPTRIKVSGRSALSVRYVEPGKDAIATLKKLTKDSVYEKYNVATDADKQDIVKLVMKYFLYVDQDPMLIDHVLKKQITSIIYIVDALTKEVDRIPVTLRQDLKERIFTLMGGLDCGYPFKISLLKLFASPGFEDNRCINHVVDNAKLIDNPLFLREAIFLAFDQLDRFRIRALAINVFPIVPPPTKRAIYYALSRYEKMPADEKRPILKTLRQDTDDWFINNDGVLI